MFSHRQCYFSRLMRSYPIFKLLDIYDRQSFIRLYVLDNVFVCILIYILFYAALWYANKVIKRIERTNNEMLLTVKENRTKLDDVIALKNKRAEYEEIVIKAKSAQRITAKHLDNEMKKLGNELVATENKMAELEKILGKMIFSANLGKIHMVVSMTESLGHEKANLTKERKLHQTYSRTSRSSNLHSRRHYRKSRHAGSTGSLPVVQPINVQWRCFQAPRNHPKKLDSSNAASAENSSSESMRKERIWPRYNRKQEGDRRRYCLKKYSSKTLSRKTSGAVKKFQMESFKTLSPFTRSVLGLAPILLRDDYLSIH